MGARDKAEAPEFEDELEEAELESYWTTSTSPLQVLVFLLPFVAFYEIGSLVWQRELGATNLEARRILSTLFEIFGVVGVHLPAVALIAVLLSWQVIGRRAWRVDGRGLGVMAVESVVWALPVLVLAAMTGLLGGGGGEGGIGSLPAGSRATIAVGAGVYEELVFRFALIAVVHTVLVDFSGMRQKLGDWFAVGFSALVFAAYHRAEVGGHIVFPALIFYLASGVYLGSLFLGRGLGIAAGAHAIYDLIVLVALPTLDRGSS
ncbi:MAG: CPBP family intramembrane metalloprotease [Phycisphaerales bacterium]|nr:CPBP family intramembrane metalloprotease [Phycisphaerales bacterium]MCB9836173.1 CPBP family intramembrane metalloprotease [Phycisphaera sp.]